MLCCSTPEETNLRKRDKALNKQIKKKFAEREQIVNLLLLGTGDGGKSTIFRQMKLLSGQSTGDKEGFHKAIHENILDSIWRISRAMVEFGMKPTDISLTGLIQKFGDIAQGEPVVTRDIATQIKQIWKDPNVQKVYSRRSEYQLNDNTAYFMGRLDEITKPGYTPSVEDILNIKIVTRSISHIDFTFEGINFHMTDVGGQRKERRKWLECFSNVKAILFVVASSEYDLTLAEDPTVNRMEESMNLFATVLKYPCFNETGFILFLNKTDVFAEKIKTTPITVLFPDYQGHQAFEESILFIKDKFLALNTLPRRLIFPHFTCATDTNNIRRVFVCVKDIVLREHLLRAGIGYNW